ncbi:MAG: two-component regulator propeller domain-containing protein, partial [Chitinophagaceae bacterium]
MTRIVALAVCMSSCFSLFAQKDQYQFETIDTRHGLSNNEIHSIFKDEKGFMWFGTKSGLNRYDGYNFKIFRHKLGDSTSINDNYVIQIAKGPDHAIWVYTSNGWNIFDPLTEMFRPNVQAYLKTFGIPDDNFTRLAGDSKNNFWFVRPRTGIYKYNAATNTTTLYNKDSKQHPLYSNNVFSVAIDHAGNTWISYSEGVIEKRSSTDNKLLTRSTALQEYSDNQRIGYRIFVDADNDLWIYSTGEIKGIYYYNASSDKLLPIRKDSKGIHLNNDLVRGVTQDDNGNIWVATDHGGVNLISKKDFSVSYLESNESDNKSISQNSINSIYKDRDGILWLGTFKKGLSYFHGNNLKFPLYQHRSSNGSSLMYNDVNRFVEDKKGNLWIGTNGGGLIHFDRANNNYTQYLHNASANSLCNNIIVSLFMDKDEKLWIGTYYGGLDCFDGKKFINYKHDDKDPFSLADDRVWEVFEDSENKLWVGTFSEGLQLFDRAKKKFIHYKPQVVHSGYVSSLKEDKEGNIWVGTAAGIDILDKRTGLFRHYEHIDNDNNSLSQNNVIDILQDSRGMVWVGTRDGLNLFDPLKKSFKTFRTEDGLPDNTVVTILEDNNHSLWVS